jgi:hypothetical protein
MLVRTLRETQKMDSGLAAIVGAAVGAIGSSAAQVVANIRQAKDRKADRRLELLENALDLVARERRLLRSHLSLWRAGLPPDDRRVEDLDAQLALAIEEVWVAENSLRVHFRSDSEVVTQFSTLLLAMDDMKNALRRRPGPSTQEDLDQWAAANKSIVKIQLAFVDAIRSAAKLD